MKEYIKSKNKKRHTFTVYLTENDKKMLDELREMCDINVSQLVRNEIEKAYYKNIVKVVREDD